MEKTKIKIFIYISFNTLSHQLDSSNKPDDVSGVLHCRPRRRLSPLPPPALRWWRRRLHPSAAMGIVASAAVSALPLIDDLERPYHGGVREERDTFTNYDMRVLFLKCCSRQSSTIWSLFDDQRALTSKLLSLAWSEHFPTLPSTMRLLRSVYQLKINGWRSPEQKQQQI